MNFNNINDNSIKNVIKTEYGFHPQLTLIDVYKLFYQDTFGPAHLLKDKKKTLLELKKETDSSVRFDKLIVQNISCLNDYYRVNLSLIKHNLIDISDFFNCLMKSSLEKTETSPEEWEKYWARIMKILDNMDISIRNYNIGKKIIMSKIKDSIPLFHHSKLYRSNYNPHYRIIAKEQLERISDRLVTDKGIIKEF